VLAKAGNLLPALFGALHEQLAVGQEVVAYGAEVVVGAQVQARGAVEGGDEISLEQVGAGRERDGVRYRCFEGVGVALEKSEGFGDGGHGALCQSFDECFNGSNGHGEFGVILQDAAIGRDNVEFRNGLGICFGAHIGGI
jgi:hypothetical protein